MKINYDLIANSLSDDGYIILSEYLPSELTTALYQHITHLPEQRFTTAGIGRHNDLQLNPQIRNDQTLWLTPEHNLEKMYLNSMDELRQQLNQRLFLGLFDYEAHFAHYAPESYYHRHVDAFKGHSNRILSSVFYLNPNWQQHEGGELIIYSPDSTDNLCHVSPILGTMALFLSERFPHEVLPAKRDRYSIAGWFSVNHRVS